MAHKYAKAWSSVPARLQEHLESCGWQGAGAMASIDDLTATEIVAEIEAVIGRTTEAEEAMAILDMVAAAGPEAKRLRKGFVLAKDMTFYRDIRPLDKERDYELRWKAADVKIAKTGKARWPGGLLGWHGKCQRLAAMRACAKKQRRKRGTGGRSGCWRSSGRPGFRRHWR